MSVCAKDLIKKMIAVNTNRRITIHEALEHPWITNLSPDTHILTEGYLATLTNLKSFHAD